MAPLRLLVISDTHGYTALARRAITERGPWDQVLHLGDSLLDAVDLAASLHRDIAAVPGNNEYGPLPAHHDHLVFDLGGVRFYALHGHDLDVNPYAGDDRLEADLAAIAGRARRAGARVALFGHTHQPLIRELNGVLLVNPGALGLCDRKPSYAAIQVYGPGRVEAAIEEIPRLIGE